MQLQLFHFLALLVIICSYNVNYVNAKALLGDEIRIAGANEFPFVATIMTVIGDIFRPPTDLLCSGVLISTKDVITTERCMKNRLQIQIHVYLGSNNLNDATRHYVSWWITYEAWAISNDIPVHGPSHDLTMLRLAAPVSNVAPAILFPQIKTHLLGLDAQVAGWVVTDDPQIPPTLMTAPVTLLFDEICKQRIQNLIGHHVYLGDYIICSAAIPMMLLNNEDFGGPLMLGNHVIGINKGRCPETRDDALHPDQVNLHYNIDFYTDFITSVTYEY